MKVMPISSNQQTTDFRGAKIRNVKFRPRSKNLTAEKQQERNYMQAICVALAFIAASFTKCIIDRFDNGNKKQDVSITIEAPKSQQQDTLQWE